jgi:hypothetical protein
MLCRVPVPVRTTAVVLATNRNGLKDTKDTHTQHTRTLTKACVKELQQPQLALSYLGRAKVVSFIY